MSTVVLILTWMLSGPSDGEALRKTAPSYLTTTTASAHLSAARLAGNVYGVDPDLLLSTAYYESRYTVDTVGPVVRGRTACGVLQPTMERTCQPQPLVVGYLAGARHLAGWRDVCHGDLRCALQGYGGGYSLIKKCARGPLVVTRAARRVDLCRLPEIRLGRARWIVRMRQGES